MPSNKQSRDDAPAFWCDVPARRDWRGTHWDRIAARLASIG
ncbi:MAG: hypothetical protein WBD63_00400 [Phycisphaerae bacterium]|nr:hypothetical protein [Phycisphaerae bacterium]